MSRCSIVVLLLLVLGLRGNAADYAASNLVPFVLPWDDASPGVTNVSAWLPQPAGKFGPIYAGSDGHLHAGAERIRFLGVNLCFAANMPQKRDAEKIAARMAKFGINVVRFHHMDMFAFPAGIRARNSSHTSELDPEALDRLDFLVAHLKRHGIYSNLNLLVSRPFKQSDGLPAEIERVDPKTQHVIGFFHEPLLRLQKEYARNLLRHRNPYTQLPYAEDAAVAFVEINNENGLLQGWLGNQVDSLPAVFLHDLQRQWNAWLRKQYSDTAKLRDAWGIKHAPPGAELLANGDFSDAANHWSLEQHAKARALVATSDDVPAGLRPRVQTSAHISVAHNSPAAWHVQFNQSGLKVQADQPYTISFWAKADRPVTLTVQLGQAHEPWNVLGLDSSVHLGNAWRSYQFVFVAAAGDANARLNFTNLARQKAGVWLAGVSLRPGGVVGLRDDEHFETDSIPIFTHAQIAERTAQAQRDWLRFLWETEDGYWQAMQRYLKEDLKVRGVVMGTIVGCSTPNLMAKFDAVDTHAYWQHPHFPGRQWDMDNWTVANRSMVNEAGGILPGLALRRVLGKPHCVTEYNHPAPNTFGSEGFLLAAAYGALQDWDAIYAFAYAQSADWNARRIQGFFDIAQHPAKMATFPAAAALFVRADVKPALAQIVVGLDKEREIELLRAAHAWDLVHAGQLGVPREAALVHRVAIATQTAAAHAQKQNNMDIPKGNARYASDTGELVWDLRDRSRGIVTINTAKSKAVVGYGSGKRFDLGGVVIAPGPGEQDGWSAITVTAMEGTFTQSPARLLITATGAAENTGMQWKSADHDSVGRNWGNAPSRVEVVPAAVNLPIAAARVRAWALDERGQRTTALHVTDAGVNQANLTLGGSLQRLWYEIAVR